MMTEEEIRKFLSGQQYEDLISEEEKVPAIKKISFSPFGEEPKVKSNRHNYDFLKDVKVEITAELGNSIVKVKDLISWAPGTVIGLNKLAGETAELYINERLVASGEIIIINDSFGVRIQALSNEKKKG